eukprot:m.66276 g.66276  ORF g.66276 m.66276 type:complete len:489 (-) comp23667_c0_seq1:130-1596(-)
MTISTRAHALVFLYLGAVVLPTVSQTQTPGITADATGITLAVPTGSNAYLRVNSVTSRLLNDDDVASIVTQAVNSAVAKFTIELDKTNAKLEETNQNLNQTNKILEQANLKLNQSNLKLNQTNAIVEALKLENVILRKNITKLGEFELCDPPATPTNGTKTVPPLFAPGTSVLFGCDDGFELNGSSESVCLQNGSLGTAAPTCVKDHALGSKERPAESCKEIYLDSRVEGITDLQSGPQWITMSGGQTAQVFCDMNTSSSDGLSGWTLCGKYDAERPGDRWLSDGFGRVPTGVADMASLEQFSGNARKWSSIDCRSLLPESRYMMHVGANDTSLPWGGEAKSAVRFTNVLEDAKLAPTHFFDTLQEDRGVCRTRTQGGIRTFNQTFAELKGDGMDGGPKMGLNNGACMVGQGHHFCSFNRLGSRLSNAGGNSAGGPCSSSDHDSIYWAWNTDDHGCNPTLRIGTGCSKSSTQGQPGTPSFRYNYMFIH